MRVVDGDTIDCDVDLGFHVTKKGVRFRLAGINAPEMRSEEGPKSKEYLARLIEGKQVVLRTKKTDKYGRWLAVVFVGGIDINRHMVINGQAEDYMTKDIPL